jgi:hypothetical protein
VSDSALVDLPAAELVRVVLEALPHNGAFAGDAQLVADEILRLRDAGHLSKSVVGSIGSSVYQGRMRSSHVGDFELTAPIARLEDEVGWYTPGRFPDAQVDPVQVRARFAQIAESIRRA